MSSGIIGAEVFRAEQVSRLARTSDPTNPEKGDAWIRTDLQPTTNSVAALRVQGGSGYLEAPLFDPSVTLGQDVYVGQRFVFSDGTEGHLLVTDQGGAVGSPRVVTSSGAEYQAHDAVEVTAIPGSSIHHWPFAEGSGTTAADSIGNADGTINGATWQSGIWVEGYSLSGDGTDDDVSVTTLDDFATALSGDWALAVTYQSTNNGGIFGAQGSSNDAGLTTESGYGAVSGAFNWRENTGSNSTIRVHTGNSSYSDGNKYRLVVNQTGTLASSIEMWVNGSQVNVTYEITGATDSSGTFDTPFTFYHINGTNNARLAGELDDPILSNASWSQAEITDDYNRQPWS